MTHVWKVARTRSKEINTEGAYERNWNLKDLLSDLIGATAELAPEPQAEIWASDLGKPYVDRWLQWWERRRTFSMSTVRLMLCCKVAVL